jgi:hypothetical protein
MKIIYFVFLLVTTIGVAHGQNTQEVFVVNLSYKVLMNPTTGAFPKADMAQNIRNSVAEMNILARNNNAPFRFRQSEDLVSIGGPNFGNIVNRWFNRTIQETATSVVAFENDAKSFPAAFAWRTNAINIYMTGVGWGGISSFPAGTNKEIVTIAVDVDSLFNIQLHEIGHFFNLLHTHHGSDCSVAEEKTGDDGISDTLADAACFDIEKLSMHHFMKTFSQLSTQQKSIVNQTFFNIMGPRVIRSLTKGQIAIMVNEMKTRRTNVVQKLLISVTVNALGNNQLEYNVILRNPVNGQILNGQVFINEINRANTGGGFIVNGTSTTARNSLGACSRYIREERRTCRGGRIQTTVSTTPQLSQNSIRNVTGLPNLPFDLPTLKKSTVCCSCDSCD